VQAAIRARRRQPRQGLEVAKRTSSRQEVNNAQISKETTALTTPTAKKGSGKIRGQKAKRRANNFRPSDTTAMAKMRGKCVNDTKQFTIIAGRVAGRQYKAVQPCLQMP